MAGTSMDGLRNVGTDVLHSAQRAEYEFLRREAEYVQELAKEQEAKRGQQLSAGAGDSLRLALSLCLWALRCA